MVELLSNEFASMWESCWIVLNGDALLASRERIVTRKVLRGEGM